MDARQLTTLRADGAGFISHRRINDRLIEAAAGSDEATRAGAELLRHHKLFANEVRPCCCGAVVLLGVIFVVVDLDLMSLLIVWVDIKLGIVILCRMLPTL